MKTFVEHDYEIHLDDSLKDYLYFVVRGQRNDYDVSMKYWPQIKDLASSYPSSNVLVHDMFSIVGEVSAADYYSLASFVTESFKGIKFAYFREGLPTLVKFAETIGINKGFGNGGVFYSLDKAKNYLLDN